MQVQRQRFKVHHPNNSQFMEEVSHDLPVKRIAVVTPRNSNTSYEKPMVGSN